MKAWFFILVSATSLFGESISGTITNLAGEHVSEVKVCTASWSCVQSNADGHYEIYKASQSIRFSHPKYNAVIKDASGDQLDVVLQKSTKATDNKRIVQYCSEGNNLVGFHNLKIVIPARNISKAQDDDYEMIVIESSKNKNEYLILMTGPTVSSGIPSWPSLEESPIIIYDRDIDYENQAKPDDGIPISVSIDIKAKSINGKFWRFIGNTHVSIITYRDVSEATALEFDKIMDTLCVARQRNVQ